jgi:hypothetical protein
MVNPLCPRSALVAVRFICLNLEPPDLAPFCFFFPLGSATHWNSRTSEKLRISGWLISAILLIFNHLQVLNETGSEAQSMEGFAGRERAEKRSGNRDVCLFAVSKVTWRSEYRLCVNEF